MSGTPAEGPSRRRFLAGLTAGAAAGTAGVIPFPAPAQEATAPPPPTPEGITREMVAAAERLMGVVNTDAERRQILAGFDQHLARLETLRAFPKPNDLHPATVFDPRLPGRTYPEQAGRVVPAKADPGRVPTDKADLAFAPVTALAAWIAAGDLRSETLTEVYLDRIARFAPRLECFVTVTADRARAEAKRADAEIKAGKRRGPLHGIPYVLKDLADTAGIPTTWGAVPYKDRIAERDATIVARLREAGAVLLGKTTLGEIAYGDVWFGGTTRNPWDPREGSSGSSAGTASAVAAGLAAFGIGTETLGSIVSPSQRCGLAGLRPTFGRVPRTGCMALCWSLDKIGPMARGVEDTALVLAALNGRDPADPASLDHGFAYDGGQDIKGLRVGYDPTWFAGEAANAVDRAALEALRGLGVTLVDVPMPTLPADPLLGIVLVEAAAAFEELTLSGRDDAMRWQGDEAWPNTWRQMRFHSAVDFVQVDRLRRRHMEAMDGVFATVDLLFGPNFAGDMLMVTNATGHPQLILRAGFVERPLDPLTLEPLPEGVAPSKTRAPHGVSLWGPLFGEGRMIAVGRALEAALGVAAERPPGF